MRFWNEVLVGIITNCFVWGFGVALHDLNPLYGFAISAISTIIILILWRFHKPEMGPATLNQDDFATIDQKNSFMIYELACFWVGGKADLPLSRKAMKQFKKFDAATKAQLLKAWPTTTREVAEKAYNFQKNKVMPNLDPYWKVNKDEAMIYTNRVKQKPAFLFKQNRAHG